MRRHSRVTLAIVSAVLFLLTLGATSARADISSYTLNINNNLGALAAGYATVTVELKNGGHSATIDFKVNSLYSFFDSNDVGVNVTAPFTASGLSRRTLDNTHPTESGNNSDFGFRQGLFSGDLVGGFAVNTFVPTNYVGSLDGLGGFNLIVDYIGGSKPPVAPYDLSKEISFDVTRNSGIWASSSQVLYPDIQNHPPTAFPGECGKSGEPVCSAEQVFAAAAHVRLIANPNSNGYATNNDGPVSVPEPTSPVLISMFASCFGLIGLVQSRRRRNAEG